MDNFTTDLWNIVTEIQQTDSMETEQLDDLMETARDYARAVLQSGIKEGLGQTVNTILMHFKKVEPVNINNFSESDGEKQQRIASFTLVKRLLEKLDLIGFEDRAYELLEENMIQHEYGFDYFLVTIRSRFHISDLCAMLVIYAVTEYYSFDGSHHLDIDPSKHLHKPVNS